MSKSTRAAGRSPLTPTALSRMQSATARQNGGVVSKGGHIGRMQRAVATAQAGKGNK